MRGVELRLALRELALSPAGAPPRTACGPSGTSAARSRTSSPSDVDALLEKAVHARPNLHLARALRLADELEETGVSCGSIVTAVTSTGGRAAGFGASFLQPAVRERDDEGRGRRESLERARRRGSGGTERDHDASELNGWRLAAAPGWAGRRIILGNPEPAGEWLWNWWWESHLIPSSAGATTVHRPAAQVHEGLDGRRAVQAAFVPAPLPPSPPPAWSSALRWRFDDALWRSGSWTRSRPFCRIPVAALFYGFVRTEVVLLTVLI